MITEMENVAAFSIFYFTKNILDIFECFGIFIKMKLYFTILFVVVSSVLFAQQKISGTITDSQNNPLIGVTVFVEELQKGTSTNENGFYELKNLPNHPIKISVVYIGFETQVKTIAVQKTETTLNFSLIEAVFKMEEINKENSYKLILSFGLLAYVFI